MNEEVESPKVTCVASALDEHEVRNEPDLESVIHLIWDRLDEAETERRRVRRTAAGVAAVVLAIAVFWMEMPGHDPRGTPIVMRDGNGTVRARLDTDPESGRTVFSLVGADGTPQAILGTDVAGPMLTFYDKKGGARLRIGLEEGSEAPVVDVMDTSTGAPSRLDLASLHAEQPVSLPQVPVAATATARATTGTSAGVRRASTRASRVRAARPKIQSASTRSEGEPRAISSTCESGLFGCLRWPFNWPG